MERVEERKSGFCSLPPSAQTPFLGCELLNVARRVCPVGHLVPGARDHPPLLPLLSASAQHLSAQGTRKTKCGSVSRCCCDFSRKHLARGEHSSTRVDHGASWCCSLAPYSPARSCKSSTISPKTCLAEPLSSSSWLQVGYARSKARRTCQLDVDCFHLIVSCFCRLPEGFATFFSLVSTRRQCDSNHLLASRALRLVSVSRD
jgi:hypothetical protein